MPATLLLSTLVAISSTLDLPAHLTAVLGLRQQLRQAREDGSLDRQEARELIREATGALLALIADALGLAEADVDVDAGVRLAGRLLTTLREARRDGRISPGEASALRRLVLDGLRDLLDGRGQ